APFIVELVANFDRFDPETGRSANITDIDFDDAGNLYVLSAQPARIYKIKPDPNSEVLPNFIGDDGSRAWVDLADATDNPRMKSENLLVDGNRVFVTSGDAYRDDGLGGAIYVVRSTEIDRDVND
ncbi:MAG: hypothetical protein AAGK78_05020, partial [Planctomycetota bacterium]